VVSDDTIWATPRASPLALEWQNRIHQRERLLRVVPVGTGQPNGERYAPPVANQMALAPALGPIGGIRTALVAAVHRADGTTVHDRPRPMSRASQSRSAKWIRSHTPACCQSRKRRQHLIPDPHPSSCGSICQAMPLRRTKTMPVRHARSETRGRPPFGRGSELGRTGSTRFHNASGSSAAAIPVHVTAHQQVDAPIGSAQRRFCYALFLAILVGLHVVSQWRAGPGDL
jgi:hypothetical protein